jgi:hypothetical protein
VGEGPLGQLQPAMCSTTLRPAALTWSLHAARSLTSFHSGRAARWLLRAAGDRSSPLSFLVAANTDTVRRMPRTNLQPQSPSGVFSLG